MATPLTPQLDELTTAGASKALSIPVGQVSYTVDTWLDKRAVSGSAISALTVKVQGSFASDGSKGVVNASGPALAIGSTAEKFANGAFTYRIADTNYNKAAIVAGTDFSSAHVVTASKFGVINIYIDSSGTLSTLSAQLGQDQTTALASATAEAALTVADGIPTPASLCYIGRILIEADAGDWTAITDDMTDGSDLTSATFISAISDFVDIDTYAWQSNDISAGRVSYEVIYGGWYKFVRLFLSAISGTARVSGNIYHY